LEFNVPFQHKHGYIRDECATRNIEGQHPLGQVMMFWSQREMRIVPPMRAMTLQ